jgi:hypothetical protein
VDDDDLVSQLQVELLREFPHAESARIDAAVRKALARTAGAPVTSFRAVLAKRDARTELRRPESSWCDQL